MNTTCSGGGMMEVGTDQIRDLERERLKKLVQKEILQSIMEITERHYEMEVAVTAKDKGLTNQTARDNEVKELLSKDAQYQKMVCDMRDLTYDVLSIGIDIRFLQREFRRWEIEHQK